MPSKFGILLAMMQLSFIANFD